MAQWFTDYHMHTNLSPDASQSATFNAYILDAEKKNHKRLVFTDHVDIDSPVELFEEYPDYSAVYKTLKRLEAKTSVEVLMGVEVGYLESSRTKISAFVNAHPFDFVIASLHATDGLDYYNGDFFKGKTDEEATKRYFESLQEMVENFEDYDVVGHLDYIVRYYKEEPRVYDFKKFEPMIREILHVIIQKGKGIEVNTSGIRYGLNTFHPSHDVLRLYYELGGKIITLGSDAHKISDRMKDFESAKDLLKSIGFSALTQFKAREAIQVKLP